MGDLLRRISGAVDYLRFLLESPTENAQELVVVLGIFLVGMFALVIAAALAFSYRRQRGLRARRMVAVTRRLARSHAAAAAWTLFGLVLGAAALTGVGFGLDYTSNAGFCNKCHAMSKFVTSWKDSSHRTVGCIVCHHEPGALGFLADKVEDLRYLGYFLTGEPKGDIAGAVSNSTCERCHRKVLFEVVGTRGLLVSHKEIASWRCTECHSDAAHPGKVEPPQARMAKCLECHNGRRAARECSTCHFDPLKFAVSDMDKFARAEVNIQATCEKCHEQFRADSPPNLFAKQCSACHILDFPLEAILRHKGEWAAVVKRMQGKGCAVSEEEAAKIANFLEDFAKQAR